MSIDSEGQSAGLALAPLLGAALVAASAGLPLPAVNSVAEATTYQIRTQTAARATQHLRSDQTFATPRVLSQSLTLAAYNLNNNVDDGGSTFNARLGIRYSTDLGIEQRYRQDPLIDARWNDLSLDIAYLEWEPWEGVQIRGGRQWHRSPLGLTDFDGLALSWEATDGDWRPFGTIAAGRDVQRGLTPFDPGAWDVQGLPPNEATVTDTPWHWMAAANVGIASGRNHRAELSARHHRRPRADDVSQKATTNRVAATASTTPIDDLTVTTTASYHSTFQLFDRSRLDAVYRLERGAVSAGIDHRRPVFHTGSIFNLFGAQPHRSAYGTYRRPIDAISTTVEIRGWTRLYFDDDAGFFDAGDSRAVGAALSNRHDLDIGIPVDVSWQVSAQTMTDRSGGDQYLGTSRVRAPAPVDDLFLTGRLTGLVAMPDHHRRDSGYATTAGLGAEYGLGDLGQFAVNFETRGGTFVPTNTALFAHFELEAWR